MDINTPLSVKLTSRGQLTGGLRWVLAFHIEKAKLIGRHQNGYGGKLSWLANESSRSTSFRKGVSLSFPECSQLGLIILAAREQLQLPLSGMTLDAKYFLKTKFFFFFREEWDTRATLPVMRGCWWAQCCTGSHSCREFQSEADMLYLEDISEFDSIPFFQELFHSFLPFFYGVL